MSFSSEEVEVLLQIAREANACGPVFRERVDHIADAFSVIVPHTSFAAYVLDMRRQEGPTSEHLVFRNRDPAALAAYAQNYIAIDPMGVAFPEGNGAPYLLSDFVRGRAFGKDAFTADFMPSLGIRHIMAFSRRMPDGKMFAFALHRDKGLKDFNAHEREAMRLVSPDLGRAIQAVLLEERVAEMACEARPDARSGAIVFGANGDVCHADARALALAGKLGGSGVPTDWFLPDVRRLLAAKGGAADLERTLPLPEGGWLRVRLSLVGSGRHRTVIALLEHASPDSTEQFEALSARYRLTAREQEVARLAVQGLGNRQIAAALRISAVTVGIHLTHVYRKTGALGRHELAALFNGVPGGAFHGPNGAR